MSASSRARLRQIDAFSPPPRIGSDANMPWNSANFWAVRHFRLLRGATRQASTKWRITQPRGSSRRAERLSVARLRSRQVRLSPAFGRHAGEAGGPRRIQRPVSAAEFSCEIRTLAARMHPRLGTAAVNFHCGGERGRIVEGAGQHKQHRQHIDLMRDSGKIGDRPALRSRRYRCGYSVPPWMLKAAAENARTDACAARCGTSCRLFRHSFGPLPFDRRPPLSEMSVSSDFGCVAPPVPVAGGRSVENRRRLALGRTAGSCRPPLGTILGFRCGGSPRPRWPREGLRLAECGDNKMRVLRRHGKPALVGAALLSLTAAALAQTAASPAPVPPPSRR